MENSWCRKSICKVATSNLVDNSAAGSPGNLYSGFGYGYQFVMNPEAGSYRSDGNYGQFCLAFPHEFTSRFILGSGKFSLDLVKACIEKAGDTDHNTCSAPCK